MKNTLINLARGIALAGAVTLGACTQYGRVEGLTGLDLRGNYGQVRGLNKLDLRDNYPNQPGTEIKNAIGVCLYPESCDSQNRVKGLNGLDLLKGTEI